MAVKVFTSSEDAPFDINNKGDHVLAHGVDADWAWFQVRSTGGGTWGSARVNLLGSLDLAGLEEREFFVIDSSAELKDFGERRVNVTGIPTLRLQVTTAQGSTSTPCTGRISFAARTSS